MWGEILKALPVVFSASLKFILGPLGGYAVGLHPVTTIIATVTGMMGSVVAFAFFGDYSSIGFGKKSSAGFSITVKSLPPTTAGLFRYGRNTVWEVWLSSRRCCLHLLAVRFWQWHLAARRTGF